MNRSLVAITAAALLCCGSANAQTDPVLNPANGHYYQHVGPYAFSFQQALAGAQSASYLGIPGHLATITSAEENAFLCATFPSRTAWIAASDVAVEGEWRWIDGPEAGQLFYKHDAFVPPGYVTGTSYAYEKWPRSSTGQQIEPNNTDVRAPRPNYGPENYATLTTFAAASANGYWNDLAGDWKNGYFIEYSPVPEPSGVALLSVALALARCVARRRRAWPLIPR